MKVRVGKPARVDVARRDCGVTSVLVLADGIVAAARDDTTTMLDRATVAVQCWQQPTSEWIPTDVLGASIVTVRRDAIALLRGLDGSEAWRAEGAYLACPIQGGLAVSRAGSVNIHDPETGSVRAVLPTPWSAESQVRRRVPGILAYPNTAASDRLAMIPTDGRPPLWDVRYATETVARVRADHGMEVRPDVFVLGSPPSVTVLSARLRHWDVLKAPQPDYLVRVSDQDGSLLWCSPPVRLDLFELTVAENRAFLPHDDGLVVLDLETGAILNTSAPGNLRDVWKVRPAVVFKNRVAVPSSSGHIVVYDTDGEFSHVVKTQYSLWKGIEADGRLIVATGQGSLLVFDESVWGAA